MMRKSIPTPRLTEKATASEVARLAGVSQSAVSRAFTPGAPISASTRTRILELAAEVGYRPRWLLRTQAEPVTDDAEIAVVMSDAKHPFTTLTLEALTQKLLRRSRRHRLLCVPNGTPLKTVIGELYRHSPAAVLTGAAVLSRELVPICRERGTPIVLLNRAYAINDVDMVACDNYAGGYDVAELMCRCGRQMPAYIAGHSGVPSSGERERGFVDRLAVDGLELVTREKCDFTYETAAASARQLLRSGKRPDFIFCVNDLTALATIDVLRNEGGLRIPEDVAVVGFDDIPMASWPSYNLTTVHQRIPAMVDEALDMIERLLRDPQARGVSRLVAGQLVLRGTTPHLDSPKGTT